MAQTNRLQNVPNMHVLLSLILLRFPPKKAKCVVSAIKSRQQIGLKAFMYMYIEEEVWDRLGSSLDNCRFPYVLVRIVARSRARDMFVCFLNFVCLVYKDSEKFGH